tara:strand:+ start:906 stop:2801 length:1896 start_codon:yes stop_codon:yes gene_type:complete
MYRYFQVLNKLISIPKPTRFLILILVDLLSLVSSYFFVKWLTNFEFILFNYKNFWIYSVSIIIFIVVYIFSGQYKSVTRFIGSKDLYKITARNLFALCLIIIFYNLINFKLVPLKILILIPLISSTFSCFVRLSLRDIINDFFSKFSQQKINKVIIYGAGSAGIQLYGSLKISRSFSVVAFVDDDTKLIGRLINGIPIISKDEIENLKFKLDKILFAIPSLKSKKKKDILIELQKFHIPIFKIPTLEELSNNELKINDLRPINLDDLLGRDPIVPNKKLLFEGIKDKVICVIGAGGSIGSQLCKEILLLGPKKLFILERNEHSLYLIENKLLEINSNNVDIQSLLICVTNKNFVNDFFLKHKIDTVFHCAAYKHVPLVERNPLPALYNNIFSTMVLCSQAEMANVKKFILVSSDKAVRPTNIMGASKRVCELIVQAYADRQYSNKNKKFTIFSMVRFGNVLGSSGSVVPLFKKQIIKGGPITLTHKEVIRYFMSVEEAAQLVLQASALSKGGDLFLLNMGKPVKIYDLACHMIKLSGLTLKNEKNIKGDIEIKTTGLRPGEKLYEELIIDGESKPTIHPLIFYAEENFISFDKLEKKLKILEEAVLNNNLNLAIMSLKKIVPNWKSKTFRQ